MVVQKHGGPDRAFQCRHFHLVIFLCFATILGNIFTDCCLILYKIFDFFLYFDE